MTWKPHVTVAAIIERDGRFLMVEERIDGQLRLNQPAGHLEDGENLLEAVVRETREETGWVFCPRFLVGIHRWRGPDRTFLRFTFAGTGDPPDALPDLDPDIERTLWLDPDAVRRRAAELRSPLVIRSLEDYLAGRRYPLELVQDVTTTVSA